MVHDYWRTASGVTMLADLRPSSSTAVEILANLKHRLVDQDSMRSSFSRESAAEVSSNFGQT
jgi:hypothetical protein